MGSPTDDGRLHFDTDVFLGEYGTMPRRKSAIEGNWGSLRG